MKNSIIIEKSGTGQERAFVRLEMDFYYKEFLQSIPNDADSLEEAFKAGVQCVVWGAFYLESTINKTAQMVLEDSTHGIIRSSAPLWSLIERAPSERTLALILEVLMKSETKRKEFTVQVKSLFDLRNRLAHYKEAPKEVEAWEPLEASSEAIDPNLRAQLERARSVAPKIVQDVLNPPVCERKVAILEIGNWIEKSVFEYYKGQDGAQDAI